MTEAVAGTAGAAGGGRRTALRETAAAARRRWDDADVRGRVVEPVRARLEPATRRAAALTSVLTPAGRGTLVVAAASWLLGWRLGWVELAMVSSACLIAVALSVVFVLGTAIVTTTIELDADRVFAGTPVAGRVVVANTSARRLFPLQVEVPGAGPVGRFDVPSLAGGHDHTEEIHPSTERRGVVVVGPASSVQGDPLGLLRRVVASSSAHELLVHPVITPLPPLGAGLLRDLEGKPTRDLSTSDLAFHTLRDYVPGDELRHVHWRSSAKADRLLVRQFLDTRRSRVTVVVDGDAASYRDEDEFETALSVCGSIGVRCLTDELDVTVVAGGLATTPAHPMQLLDSLARGGIGGPDQALGPATAKAATLATDTSFPILVTGSVVPFADLRGALRFFGAGVSPLAVRVEPDAPAGVSQSGELTVLALRELTDLAGLMLLAAR